MPNKNISAITDVKRVLLERFNDTSLHTLMTKVVMTDELGLSWTYFDECLHRYYDLNQGTVVNDDDILSFIEAYRKEK